MFFFKDSTKLLKDYSDYILHAYQKLLKMAKKLLFLI